MHRFTAVLIVASALAAPALAETRGDVAPKAPPTVVTRQMQFQLPFQLPKADATQPAPIEVRLFVSRDEGRTWQIYSRVRPDKGSFPFVAKADGDYWFMVRTVDGRGNLWPQSAPTPEMRVTVDTQPPKAELNATWNSTGEVAVAWQVADATLEPTSPKLQYLAAPTGTWQTVAITPASQEQTRNQSGKATWWPRAATGEITVRFEALDKAGNPAVVQRTIAAPGSATAADLAKKATPEPPIANPFADPKQPPAAPNTAATPGGNQTPAPPQQPTRDSLAARAAPSCAVKLTSTARQDDRLTIRWQTSGTSILSKTIHLAYGDSAEGPWKPVALNQQDDGHHIWQFNDQVPDQVFLMIEVVDRSGASSRYITPQALWLRPKPSTIPHTGQLPAEYRFY